MFETRSATMSRRELVQAAIAHRPAPRVPYLIDLCPDAWDELCRLGLTGGKTPEEFVDNDVQDIGVPWWNWHNLAADWAGDDFPVSPATCLGYGSYVDLPEQLKRLREQNDKYFLVRIYGSHFEKAYVSRGIENFLADMAGEPAQAKKLLGHDHRPQYGDAGEFPHASGDRWRAAR